MLPVKKIIIIAVSILFSSVMLGQQHPDYKKIDSLKNLIATSNGTQRIDCLNALCEEHWWPPRVEVDSIDKWAGIANKESVKINYVQGIATSIMLFGVSEIYRKKFGKAEKYFRQALNMFETLHSDFGLGWCNVWLGQSLYSQTDFTECLACLRKAAPFLNKEGEWDGLAKAWAWTGGTYAILGNYDSSYFYCSKSLEIRQKMSDHSCVAYAFINMGHLYEVAGSNEDALGYYQQAFNYANTHGVDDYFANWIYYEPVGNIYRLMNSPDSSYFYLQRALQNDPNNQTKHISFAETLLQKNEYDSALQIFLNPIENFRKENDKWDLMRVLFDIAKTYEGRKEDKKALPYAMESLSIAQQAQTKQNISDAYQVLSMLYKHLEKNDSAYFYLQQYISLKDSLTNKQFLWRLTNYKKQTDFKRQIEQVTLLEKDNNIKEAKLKNASLLKWALLIGILLLAMSSVIIYRGLALKRKNEKLKSDREQAMLKQSATELEMQALRAQMNPHFIFNCLSSINRFILKNETEAASDYLTKFSRLIRMVLTNSNKTFITVEDELDMLKLYLDMERLRFKDSFDYSITFTNSIDVNNVFVPPLLLQPFAENAIWHGLMHKEGQGHLEIALSIENKILTCMITDNGVGRSKAAMFKSKSAEAQKSMGLHITTSRLALLNKDMNEQTFFNFEDIKDDEGNSAGTRVILKMHYRNLMEASA
jgi:tetratricopeptide (TPR) repeat protein